MNIAKYASYFHDGSIINIQHKKDNILISMESAEVSKNELEEDIILSEYNTLKGILHLEVIKVIYINGTPFSGELQMLADSGGILDFEMTAQKVRFFIEWVNFPPKTKLEKFSEVVIEAQKIYWENVPDLYDPFA